MPGGHARHGPERDDKTEHLIEALEISAKDAERRVIRLLFRPDRADDKRAEILRRAKKEMQPFERVRVAPLEIVDHEQQPSRRGEDAGQRFKNRGRCPLSSRGSGGATSGRSRNTSGCRRAISVTHAGSSARSGA